MPPLDAATNPSSTTVSYLPLQTVQKTMMVLEEFNRHPTRRIQELSQTTGIPAPTMVRILETLCDTGYVRKISRQTGYCLTSKIAELAAGYDGLPRIIEVSRPIMANLAEQIEWPVGICTYDENAMTVQCCAAPSGPLAHRHSVLPQRHDLLRSAPGKVWLAYAPDRESLLAEATLPASPTRRNATNSPALEIEHIVSSVQRAGFARSEIEDDHETITFAAPIFDDSGLVATLCASLLSSARQDPAIVIEKLQAAAHLIGRQATETKRPSPIARSVFMACSVQNVRASI